MKISHLALSGLLVVLFTFPLTASALGVWFGGRVTAATPCHIGPVPAWYITITNLALTGFTFVWVPGTLTFLNGLPHPPAYALGVADVPVICFIGTIPLPPAERIQMVGTSAI